jgi:hypothetical protein
MCAWRQSKLVCRLRRCSCRSCTAGKVRQLAIMSMKYKDMDVCGDGAGQATAAGAEFAAICGLHSMANTGFNKVGLLHVDRPSSVPVPPVRPTQGKCHWSPVARYLGIVGAGLRCLPAAPPPSPLPPSSSHASCSKHST